MRLLDGGGREPTFENSYAPTAAEILDALRGAELPASVRQLRRWRFRGWADDTVIRWRLQELRDMDLEEEVSPGRWAPITAAVTAAARAAR